MATARQKLANQANAKRSTGPRTPEGKAIASQNRISHGFESQISLIRGEDNDEFSALVHSFLDEYGPATNTEQILVEKMAHHQWLTLRAIGLQDTLLNAASSLQTEIPKDLALLLRYQTTHERAFYKAHTELLKVQEQRAIDEIGFEPQNANEPIEPEPIEEVVTSSTPVEATPPPPDIYAQPIPQPIAQPAQQSPLKTAA